MFNLFNKKPFFIIITPIFDQALESVKLLIDDLKRQSYKNFQHILISNGLSPETKKYIEDLSKTDKRFVYDEIDFEETPEWPYLLANLGKRRDYCLKKYTGERYLFMDADLKLLDNSYFLKLQKAHKKTKMDVILTLVEVDDGKVLPIFPIKLSRIDMANFTFSKKIAKTYSYPTDFDPEFSVGNDYRFFSKISNTENTILLNFISARRNGNKKYKTITEQYVEDKNNR